MSVLQVEALLFCLCGMWWLSANEQILSVINITSDIKLVSNSATRRLGIYVYLSSMVLCNT